MDIFPTAITMPQCAGEVQARANGSFGVIAARGTAGRAALSLAQQTSLSILGTLAATAILAGLKAEWAFRPGPQTMQAAAPPSLTSGGKFAARAENAGDPEPFVALTLLPPVLPMFTIPTMPGLSAMPKPASSHVIAQAAAFADDPASAGSKPPHAVVSRHDIKRVAVAPPQSPRRNVPPVIAMSALPDLSGAGAASEDRSLWSRSRGAYRQVAAWSGSLVDHLLP